MVASGDHSMPQYSVNVASAHSYKQLHKDQGWIESRASNPYGLPLNGNNPDGFSVGEGGYEIRRLMKFVALRLVQAIYAGNCTCST